MFQKFGPRKKLRPTVPVANGGKTVVVGITPKLSSPMKLNRLGIIVSGTLEPCPSRTLPRLTPGAATARGQGVSGVSAPAQSNTVNGKPVWNAKIPVNCQPLRSQSFQLLPPPHQFPPRSPKGTSQLRLPMKRCLT